MTAISRPNPEIGWRRLSGLLAGTLSTYPLLPAVRADLLARLGRAAEARAEFERAAALTRNAGEQAIFQRRAAAL